MSEIMRLKLQFLQMATFNMQSTEFVRLIKISIFEVTYINMLCKTDKSALQSTSSFDGSFYTDYFVLTIGIEFR